MGGGVGWVGLGVVVVVVVVERKMGVTIIERTIDVVWVAVDGCGCGARIGGRSEVSGCGFCVGVGVLPSWE